MDDPKFKFADLYPEANFITFNDNGDPVKVAVIGQSSPVEYPPWTFDYKPFAGEIELWIGPDEHPCYNDRCQTQTRFFVWESSGTRQFACSKECGQRAAQIVWRGGRKKK
jgi:hypothetical protein